ncbi:MAG: ABC transporter permease [Actinomycetota bacterium]
MTTWVVFALLGVGTGAMYAALAVGLIVAYRGSGVVNFAVGAMAMIPAVIYAELRTTGDLILPVVVVPNRYAIGGPMEPVPATAIAVAVSAVVSVVVYLLVVRPLRSAPRVTMLVATVGLTIVLEALAVKSFGNRVVRTPSVLPDGDVTVFGRIIPVDRFVIVGVVVVLATVVHLTLRHTRFGLATRAAFLDEKGAILLGLDPSRLGLYNWLFGSTVAAIVGILASSLGGVGPFVFSLYTVPAFGAALAARLVSVRTATIVGVAIGSFEAIAVHLVAREQVPSFFLGGISSLVPFVVVIAAVTIAGSTLPDRSMILEGALVRVERRPLRLPAWIGTIAVGVVVLSSSDPTVRLAAIQSIFVVLLLMSIVVLTGLLGQVSLAQLSFAGVSAFALSKFDGWLPFPFGAIAAIAVTTIVGVLVATPALRIRGIQFAIVTFAVAVMFDEVLFRSPTFVGGDGIATVRSPSMFGIELGIFGDGQFPERRFGYLVLGVAVAVALAVHGIRRSNVGRRLLAVRANERAAASTGIHVPRTKVLGAAIATFVAAVAGVVFAYKSTTFTGAGLDATTGLEYLALAYLGGIGSIAGAVIGGVLAPSGLFIVVVLGGGSSIDQFLLTGLGLIVVALRFPVGLVGIGDRLTSWWQERWPERSTELSGVPSDQSDQRRSDDGRSDPHGVAERDGQVERITLEWRDRPGG